MLARFSPTFQYGTPTGVDQVALLVKPAPPLTSSRFDGPTSSLQKWSLCRNLDFGRFAYARFAVTKRAFRKRHEWELSIMDWLVDLAIVSDDAHFPVNLFDCAVREVLFPVWLPGLADVDDLALLGTPVPTLTHSRYVMLGLRLARLLLYAAYIAAATDMVFRRLSKTLIWWL
ncbi:hypothetical protein Nepgr_006608 [Nepenthes gracilis]|uniref:Uncharacterized protein n=1 Tax=Nepenthes gracilis TaxID=150966 RepID=A0AAD3XHI9_NEPGR|nr:hypothetical protein Nepgr_006608 [Nepenthes gracilis]